MEGRSIASRWTRAQTLCYDRLGQPIHIRPDRLHGPANVCQLTVEGVRDLRASLFPTPHAAQ